MQSHDKPECFISVDIETSGPIPGAYSVLSIGACVASSPDGDHEHDAFYCIVKPLPEASADPDALKVTGLSLVDLAKDGLTPADAMAAFDGWIRGVAGDALPVFVGLNAAFDWSFINYYFHSCIGRNPFGFAPLDIKSLYMGATGCAWQDSKSSRMTDALRISPGEQAHHALSDAQHQARLFTAIRAMQRKRH